ncbi:MAG TPA: UpxY family transcription antiterminator [Draconibacterium sp.]|nr:UpxY family transcription antiterminator [Draconibacterium sp.]
MITLHAQKHWHVVYTRSRAEKQVALELSFKNIKCYLPLQKKLRQWKDRKKWVEAPLIPGYCFVHITGKEYDKVLQLNNVVCYITFEGKAAIVSQQEIDSMRTLLEQFDFEVDVTRENFEAGRLVEIIEGPMVGLRGELIESRGKNKFALQIEQIGTAFLVEIPARCLSAVPETVY